MSNGSDAASAAGQMGILAFGGARAARLRASGARAGAQNEREPTQADTQAGERVRAAPQCGSSLVVLVPAAPSGTSTTNLRSSRWAGFSVVCW